MNNSKLALDSIGISLEEDTKVPTQEREAKLLRIIEALQKLRQSEEWSTLKNDLFDELPLKLERQLKAEAKKEEPSSSVLNRLTGQLLWAERYSDLDKLETSFRLELSNIKRYGKTQEKPGTFSAFRNER